MTYTQNVKEYSSVDLTKIGIEYPINLLECDKETVRAIDEEFYIEGDTVWMSERDIEEFKVPYIAVAWEAASLLDFDIADTLSCMIKPANHYLVVLYNGRWTGASGYKIVDSLSEVLHRGYDANIYPVSVSRGGKILRCREHHHDVPMGHTSYIIALTDKEYEEFANMDVDTLLAKVAARVS